MNLSSIDLVFFSILLILGFYIPFLADKFQPKHSSGVLQQLLMGRQLTLPLFVLSLVSTWYGGIFGVTQLSYEEGIYNFFTQGIFWYATYLIYAFFLAKKIQSESSKTLSDLAVHHFGESSRKTATFFNLLNAIPLAYFISLALFIQIITNLEYNYCLLITAILCIPTIFIKEWRHQVYQDAYQTIMMVIGLVTVLIFSFIVYGLPHKLIEHLPSSHFSITGNKGILETLSWGLLAATTLIDPAFHQRVSASRDTKTAKWGIIYSIFFWLIIDICTTLGGMYARAYAINEKSELAYFHFSLNILPDGLKGLFIFTILITILSTLDSYLTISRNTLGIDLWKNSRLTAKRKNIISGFVTVFFCWLLAQFFTSKISEVWQIIGGLSASNLLIPFCTIFLNKKTPKGIEFNFICLTTSIVYCLFWFFKIDKSYSIPLVYGGLAINGLLYIALFSFKKLQRR